jgi:beta-glucosidase
LIYTPNNGVNAPQDNFVEGVFIDYRAFDKSNTSPIYEFGYGLSYTTFSYSNLQINAHPVPAYTSSSARTAPAPTYGTINNSSAAYLFPADFPGKINAYVYPFLNSTDLAASSGDPNYGVAYSWPDKSYDSSAQPILAAGSSVAPGGNERLYDVLFTVSATVTNTGSKYSGDEVAQVYVSLGGPNDPKVVLRGFEKVRDIAPGASATFSVDITRRDVSNWDTVSQNWVISSYPKTVYVGSSSRKLPLSGALVFGAPSTGGGGNNGGGYTHGSGAPSSTGASTGGAVHPTGYTTPVHPTGYTSPAHPTTGTGKPSTMKTASSGHGSGPATHPSKSAPHPHPHSSKPHHSSPSSAASANPETHPHPPPPYHTKPSATTTTSCAPTAPGGYAPPPPPPPPAGKPSGYAQPPPPAPNHYA